MNRLVDYFFVWNRPRPVGPLFIVAVVGLLPVLASPPKTFSNDDEIETAWTPSAAWVFLQTVGRGAG